MRTQILFSVFLTLFLKATIASATPPLAVISAMPTLEGNGCPKDSYSVVLAPDSTSVSVLFSSFNLSVPAKKTTVKTEYCGIKVPVKIQPGYQMQVTSYDIRGYVSTSSKAYGLFYSYFWYLNAGLAVGATPFQEAFYPGTDEDLTISPGVKMNRSIGCKDSRADLHFGNWPLLESFKSTGSSLLEVDSFDFSLLTNSSTPQVQFSKCK